MRRQLAQCDMGYLARQDCNHLHLFLGSVSLHLSREELLELTGMLIQGIQVLTRESKEDRRAE
ncbi:MAG: hypothetical protein KDK25_10880 [Leptospiraceae bacterium]|nr:hypothetical protein [Leptospiraceae bacterium]MCB1170833.1 hypothetical protein [Leptospiraceae bacterium]